MTVPRVAALAIAVMIAGCQATPRCALKGSPEVVWEEGAPDAPGGRRLALWEVPDEPVLWSTTLPVSPSLAHFRSEVRRRVGDVGQRGLLERAIATVGNQRERDLTRQVLAVADRRVVPMRCFDALFIARQTERLDMIATPSEVAAVVFRSADGERLRIVEYTVNAAGIGNVGRIRAAVDAVIASGGWHLWSFFHNHNFFFEGDTWRGGAVAPSGPDGELLLGWHDELGLAEAWISNGFSTSLLPLSAPELQRVPVE